MDHSSHTIAPHINRRQSSLEHADFLSQLKQSISKSELPDRIMSGVADQLLPFSGEGLNSFLHSILDDPRQLERVASRSYRHGNGFYKVVLGSDKSLKLRLHIWLPGELGEENIHDHRWAFASTILCGQLESEIFAEALTNEAKAYREYIYFAKNGDCPAHVQPNGEVRLVCTKRIIRHSGEAYHMAPGTLHRIVTTGGDMTATLMYQAAPARAWNRLIPAHDLLPDVEQEYLEPKELQVVLEYFLDTWRYTNIRSFS